MGACSSRVCPSGNLVFYEVASDDPLTIKVLFRYPMLFTCTKDDIKKLRVCRGMVDFKDPSHPLVTDVEYSMQKVEPIMRNHVHGTYSFAVVYGDKLVIADGYRNLVSYADPNQVVYQRLDVVRQEMQKFLSCKLTMLPRDEAADQVENARAIKTMEDRARMQQDVDKIQMYSKIQTLVKQLEATTDPAMKKAGMEEVKRMCVTYQEKYVVEN